MPPHASTQDDIAALRAFNRLYTRKLGLLNSRLDGGPFSLTEARILYELAHRRGATAAEITRVLDLDPAQLSRTLQRFAIRGLVVAAPHPDGGRSRVVTLTAAGRAAYADLDRAARAAIGGLLESLAPDQRDALLATARTVTRLFGETPPTLAVLRDLQSGDLGWIAHRQGRLYAREYGWSLEFEALVARLLADFVDTFDPTLEQAWVAEVDSQIVGSIFLMRGDVPKVGKLRLLYVESGARGLGVGGRLVRTCIARAREVGYGRLTLWTNSVLTAARALYQREGFVLVEEAPHRAFGQDLVGQTWSLDL